MRSHSGGRRRCPACSAILADDNTARLCGRCHREQRDQLLTPPAHLKADFFETDAFRVAFESQHIGLVLKAYRNHPRHLALYGKPLNQEMLGRWLGVTQGYISKLENGRPEQNLDALRNYAEILHLPRHLLWFDFPGHSRLSERQVSITEWRVPSFESTQNDGSSSETALVMMAASESARFGMRIQVAEIHASTMDQIEEEVRRLSVDFISGDHFDTFIRSRQVRNDVFSLLEQRAHPAQEQLLYGLAARSCGYLAAASSDFYGRYDAAADQIRTARRFADISGLPELRAWVLALQSGISFWHGNYVQAATFAERSQELAVTRSGVMRATAMRARALARLRDVEGLRATITSSEASSVDSVGDFENGMILFGEANHLRCIGSANLWIGDSTQAFDQLNQALRIYLAETPQNTAVIAVIRADIARAFLDQRDIDGALEALSPLFNARTGIPHEGTSRRLRDMLNALNSDYYSGSHVASDLSDMITSFLETTASPTNGLEER